MLRVNAPKLNGWFPMSRSNTERIQFSVIIPVLNESPRIEKLLASLRKQTSSFEAEIIVVDGGSEDDTLQRARAHCDHAVQSTRGRARQQNFGANIAMGDTLVFLHADTTLPADAFHLISNALNPSRLWGRFDVTLDSHDARLRLVATMMNLRSRSTGIATGDQCIFVRRRTFVAV
ncbi:MAG: glycosyltransferase, partial [Burkholderiales bacterium]